MKLTGNSLEQFEKWLFDKRFEESFLIDVDGTVVVALGVLDFFKQLDVSMQYGVLVDFFDSVGIDIDVAKSKVKGFKVWVDDYLVNNVEYNVIQFIPTRPQARAKAIEKANEILNSRV